MNTKVEIMGLQFDNPLLPAAGPLTEGLDNLLSLNAMPLGGLVTKTISVTGAEVKKPCMAATRHMVYNTELWSEYDLEYWVAVLPELVKQMEKPLGISVGYTEDELRQIIPRVERFADFFEVSTHYNKASLESMVKAIVSLTGKPVLIKMSPHIDDDLHFVETVLKNGAAGVVAFNSFGPGLLADLKNRKLLLGNSDGNAWVSGPAIKPFALRRIANIRAHFPAVPIIGCGGVETAADLLEMVMAGADLVQMLSSGLMNGREAFNRLIQQLPKVMSDNHISSIQELRQTGLVMEVAGKGQFPVISDACTACLKCVRCCPFGAYAPGKPPVLDRDKCIRCGLCESLCPMNAISEVLT
jgi:dihydroorotate dehydrogenase/NAD-dependent dihydropyrimidine dehydrogenase PreA subunit